MAVLGTLSSLIAVGTFSADIAKRVKTATDGEVALTTAEKVELQLEAEFEEHGNSVDAVNTTLERFELDQIAIGLKTVARDIYNCESDPVRTLDDPFAASGELLDAALSVASFVLDREDTAGDATLTDLPGVDGDPDRSTTPETAVVAVSTGLYALNTHLGTIRRFEDGAFTTETNQELLQRAATFLRAEVPGEDAPAEDDGSIDGVTGDPGDDLVVIGDLDLGPSGGDGGGGTQTAFVEPDPSGENDVAALPPGAVRSIGSTIEIEIEERDAFVSRLESTLFESIVAALQNDSGTLAPFEIKVSATNLPFPFSSTEKFFIDRVSEDVTSGAATPEAVLPSTDFLTGRGDADSILGAPGDDTLRGDRLCTNEARGNTDTEKFAADDALDGGPGFDLALYDTPTIAEFDDAAGGSDAIDLPVFGETPDGLALGISIPKDETLGAGQSTAPLPIGTDRPTGIEIVEFGAGAQFVNVGDELVRIANRSAVKLGTNAASDLLDDSGEDARLLGLAGADTLEAGAGEDSLWGGSGEDRLTGRAGRNLLKSGTGIDC